MFACFKYRDPSKERLIANYTKYIDTVTPFFTVEKEIIDFMNEKEIDYFKVSRKQSTIDRELYFKFNERIENINGTKVKFFIYDKDYIK